MKAVTPDLEMQSIAIDLHKGLAGQQKARSKTVLHASDVTKEDFCAREVAFLRKYDRPLRKETIGASLSMTFQLGHAVEDIVINALGTKVVGDWQCVFCDTYYRRCIRPMKCKKPFCKSKEFKHHEIRIEDKRSGISSGVDLFVRRPSGKLRLIECKSMKDDRWKELEAPLGEHRLRTQLYLEMARRSHDPFFRQVISTRAEIVYVTKNGYGIKNPNYKKWKVPYDSFFSPFKTFWVKSDTNAVQHLIDVGTELESGKDPKFFKRICPHANDKRARVCSVADVCFGSST